MKKYEMCTVGAEVRFYSESGYIGFEVGDFVYRYVIKKGRKQVAGVPPRASVLYHLLADGWEPYAAYSQTYYFRRTIPEDGS